MKMTFRQYIENPLGKKNAVFSQRDMYKDLYTKKYGAVLLRENGTFVTELYYDKKTDCYYCYMKIPSEVVEKFYYDVVIEFYPIDATNATANDLTNYGARFWSNDPAFVFTYQYVFSKNELFIDQFKAKSSKIALKQKPDERNPYGIPGYVKSLYFCYLHMKSRSLFNKVYWRQNARPYNQLLLLNKLEKADKKIADRQRLGAEVAKKKRKEQSKSSTKPAVQKPIPKAGSIVNVVKPKSPIKGKTSTNKNTNVRVINKK
jgi:hypothetical protein